MLNQIRPLVNGKKGSSKKGVVKKGKEKLDRLPKDATRNSAPWQKKDDPDP